MCGALSGTVRRIRIAIFFKPPSCSETQQDARRAQKAEQQRCAGAFTAAEENMERRSIRTGGHQRLENAIDRRAAQKQPERDGEKLKGVAAGVDAPMQVDGDGCAQDYVQIRVHDGHR